MRKIRKYRYGRRITAHPVQTVKIELPDTRTLAEIAYEIKRLVKSREERMHYLDAELNHAVSRKLKEVKSP